MDDTAGKGSSGKQAGGEKLDSRVIPVMREAVTLVQLALFRRLKQQLASSYGAMPGDDFRRFVGCIVSDLFGTPASEIESREFAVRNSEAVEKELWAIAGHVPELLPLLTDALRMQTLCDHEEGVNSLPTLLRARALGVLQEERSIPMPSTFMLAVRKLGAQEGLLKPLEVRDPDTE